jgi:mannosyltransferase OCH1-like enzyme
MIPKLFHQIWLGPAPMHPMMLRWQAAWKKLHPGWTLKLWRGGKDGTLVCGDERLTAHYPDLLAHARHFAQQANIWRLEVLLEQGGIYLDTDMQPLKNIEPAIADLDAFVMPMYLEPEQYSSAFLGATLKHPWIADALGHLPDKDPMVHMSMGDKHITEAAKRSRVHVLDRNAFMCVYMRSRHDPARLAIKPGPGTYAVHQFSGQWWPTAYRHARKAARP